MEFDLLEVVDKGRITIKLDKEEFKEFFRTTQELEDIFDIDPNMLKSKNKEIKSLVCLLDLLRTNIKKNGFKFK